MGPETDLDRFEALVKTDPARAQQILQSVKRTIFVPHTGGQRQIMESRARFRVVRAGRRFGKTKVAARELIRSALEEPGSMNWWVANTFKNTRRGYREVVRQIPKELLAKPAASPTANDLILYLKNGSQLEFYTAGSPDALAGEGVNFVVVDEAALIPESVWWQLIRPTLMDSHGRALIISTPRGRNWFWKVWNMGQDPRKRDYASWHFSSYDNPYIDDEEIDEAKETLPDILYQQEILAEFIENAASIFRWKDDAVLLDPVTPAGQIYMGIDLAKKEDFTVISASRGIDRLPVYREKFNDISWPAQRERIHDAYDYLASQPGVDGVTVGIDSTGIGDVIFDDLEEEGMDVIPINFGSGRQKEKMVTLLAADLERGNAFLLEDQVPEFSSYEYTMTDAGRYKFEAATGHDDEVSAKLIEHWITVNEATPEVKVIEINEQAMEEAEKISTTPVEEIVADDPMAIMNRAEAWA